MLPHLTPSPRAQKILTQILHTTMSENVNQTKASDDAAVNIGATGSSFVPVEARTITPPSDVHPTAVVGTTDATAPAQTANSRPMLN